MSHNPNTVKSQDDINQGGRKSDVLLSTIEELEKVKKERDRYYKALMQIQYKTPALCGNEEDMTEALYRIDCICEWALRPEEMLEQNKEAVEKIRELNK